MNKLLKLLCVIGKHNFEPWREHAVKDGVEYRICLRCGRVEYRDSDGRKIRTWLNAFPPN